MEKQRKVSVRLPEELIKRALRQSGLGLAPTLRQGLELIAARNAYRKLLKLKGRFDLGITSKELRAGRE